MKVRIATQRKGERGQTIALVAVSLVALLGMAALSIDVVTLYVARGEAQRAADAAALAGASIFAASSFTTVPGSFTASTVCTTAGPGSAAAVNKLAEAAANENSISNLPAAITNVTCTLVNGNPQVSVTVRRNNLPTFFSRMWSSANTSVSATALAEAYNASGQTATPTVKGVKPWLLPNCDPLGTLPGCVGHQFVDPATGAIPAGSAYIGTQIDLTRINPTASPPTTPVPGKFYPMELNSASRSCPAATSPSCGSVLNNDYEDDISCASSTQVSCGLVPSGTMSVLTTAGSGYGNRTRRATRCLIHADNEGLNQGQDEIIGAGPPLTIRAGDNYPISSLNGETVSSSDSVVTVPLYDGGILCTGPGACGNAITVVGFLQIGISQTTTFGPGGPQLRGVILNAVGCNGTAPGVLTGTTSPVAVRLIHQ
jgi:hypothetical protein